MQEDGSQAYQQLLRRLFDELFPPADPNSVRRSRRCARYQRTEHREGMLRCGVWPVSWLSCSFYWLGC